MTTTNRLTLAPSELVSAFVQPQLSTPALPCALRWRQGKLWVSSVARRCDIPLPALGSPEWFRACLGKSKATVVCIDPALGTEVISCWARACQEADKPLYLRIPASPHLPAKQRPLAWMVKRWCDFTVALLLLILLSPLMLLIAGLINLQDGGPVIATQWRVGERGRLFRVFNFRTVVSEGQRPLPQMGIKAPEVKPPLTVLGQGLKQTHLDKLPLLLNVLRGELSLVGPHPWAIYETLMLPEELRTQLHNIPGITGTLQNFAQFPLTNPALTYKIACQDLRDLDQWSLRKDLQRLTTATLNMLALPL
jgi:lipopolysaccharide/colanic/teichoic acid biosynthesis glycosyltransferase